MASISADVISAISTDISQSLKTPHRLKYPVYLSYSEGGGGSTGVLECELTNKEFFAKVGGMQAYDMLRAEFLGVTDIYNTQSIRVPQPICFGSHDSVSYLIFEKLSLGGYGSDIDKARKLVAMHRNLSPNSMFGYHINNTIGATFQPNTYTADWAEFWDIYRLGHMLTLAKREGAVFQYEEEVRKKTKEILRKHDCQPSLVHGDLWSGNQGFLTSGEPVIYDPATYYGDREVDIAMTRLFGANSQSFYDEYNKLWPLPPGHEIRKVIYNLYHILNHYVLFGGGYLSQAQSMMGQILNYQE